MTLSQFTGVKLARQSSIRGNKVKILFAVLQESLLKTQAIRSELLRARNVQLLHVNKKY